MNKKKKFPIEKNSILYKAFIVLAICFGINTVLPSKPYAEENNRDTQPEQMLESFADVEETVIPVTELDLGDCPKELTLGTSQLLNVSVIPANATQTECTYMSDNPGAVTVNALGRVTAKQIGTAVITVTCGNVSDSFVLSVVPEEDAKVAVQDIEIADYEKELEVDKTVNLSVTVLPSDATDNTVTYRSSNESVAVVNSSGEVKGIRPGQVVIYATAGGITKEAALTVKKGTAGIELNSDYKILKPGETFQIHAKITPAEASQNLCYKSLDTSIATVSASGTVTARACGNTAIVISNGDLQVSLNLIVNKQTAGEGEREASPEEALEEKQYPDCVNVWEYPVITKDMLRYFYENKRTLVITGEHYIIKINGWDIVNCDNEFVTELSFEKKGKNISFKLNQGNKLCGKITIEFDKSFRNKKYIYIYNDAKKQYERLEDEEVQSVTLDTEGQYLLTEDKLSGMKGNLAAAGVGGIVVIVIGAVYVGVRRRYWFW